MIDLFVNTGIQEFDVVRSDDDVAQATGVDPAELAAALGINWVRAHECGFARIKTERRGTAFHFRIAIDTTPGDPTRGFAPVDDVHYGSYSFSVSLRTPDDFKGQPLQICEVTLLGNRHLGQPISVTLVLDVGNSRTCALVIEDEGGTEPFTLDSIRPIHLAGSSISPIPVFPSVIEFTPAAWKQGGTIIEYSVSSQDKLSNLLLGPLRYQPFLKAHFDLWPEEVFGNNGMAAIGFDADSVRTGAAHSSPTHTGLSSPKRYLWDSEQLGHAWCSLPAGRSGQLHKIQGQLLQFVTLDDNDSVLAHYPRVRAVAREDPSRPNYPRRAMMIFFLFELLRESFHRMNSTGHRVHSPHPQRSRVIRHLVLTYPSAMSRTEVARFEKQAKKALGAFGQLCQSHVPEVSLSVDLDEGVASHVTFLCSELLSGDRILPTAKPFRVAAVDIGGGTIDLAIARYELGQTVGERRCTVEYVDGAYIGGDDVVRQVIAEIIIPQFDTLAEAERLANYFQGTVGGERLAQRMRFIRSCLQPLAFECLKRLEARIDRWSLSVSDFCSPEVLAELDRFLIVGGEKGFLFNWELEVSANQVDEVLDRVVGHSLARFRKLITEHGVDYVLMAGRLSSLPRVREFLGGNPELLTVIDVSEQPSLHRTYKEIFGPVDVDPKTMVAVGAALDWCAKVGRSPTAEKVVVDYSGVSREFVWGFVSPATGDFIDGPVGRHLLEWDGDLTMVSFNGTQFLGRRLREAGEDGAVVPRYRLRAEGAARAKLRRRYDENSGEEGLELVADPECPAGKVEFRDQSKIDGVYWLDTGKLLGEDL